MRYLARVVAIVGALAIGAFLLRSQPRDLTLVYDLAPPGAPATLEVEILQGPTIVRRSELAVPPSGGEIRHRVRLPTGDYSLSWHLYGPVPYQGRTMIEVRGEGPIRVNLVP